MSATAARLPSPRPKVRPHGRRPARGRAETASHRRHLAGVGGLRRARPAATRSGGTPQDEFAADAVGGLAARREITRSSRASGPRQAAARIPAHAWHQVLRTCPGLSKHWRAGAAAPRRACRPAGRSALLAKAERRGSPAPTTRPALARPAASVGNPGPPAGLAPTAAARPRRDRTSARSSETTPPPGYCAPSTRAEPEAASPGPLARFRPGPHKTSGPRNPAEKSRASSVRSAASRPTKAVRFQPGRLPSAVCEFLKGPWVASGRQG